MSSRHQRQRQRRVTLRRVKLKVNLCQRCAATLRGIRREHGSDGLAQATSLVMQACPACRGQLLRYKLAAFPACRVCGCTDEDCSGCVRRTGEPCSWVEADLCSACVPALDH
jgi:hypothetical protein